MFNAHTMILIVHIFMDVNKFCLNRVLLDHPLCPVSAVITMFRAIGPSGSESQALPIRGSHFNRRLRALTSFLSCCLTSMEARWPIRDGDRVGRGRQSEGSTAKTARKRPESPWTAARTMEVLRRCPLAIAQRLVHCAIDAVLGQSH